eukprot:532476_1
MTKISSGSGYRGWRAFQNLPCTRTLLLLISLSIVNIIVIVYQSRERWNKTTHGNTIFTSRKEAKNTIFNYKTTHGNTIFTSRKEAKNTIFNYKTQCIHQNYTDHPNMIIAGQFNTGTNALWNYISPNCKGHLYWQHPSWGKHAVLNSTIVLDAKHRHIRNINIDNDLVVVLIKDPLTWIKSMCKMPYDAHFYNKSFRLQTTCPKGVEHSTLYREYHDFPIWDREEYESLVHFWNAYYESYINQMNHINLLIIKFEYLLFESETMIKRMCNCFGKGQLKNPYNISILKKAAKDHIHGGNKSKDRKTAQEHYGDPSYRYQGFAPPDLRYIYDHVNKTILRMFDYEFDPNYVY